MLIDTHAHLWWPSYYPVAQDQPGYFDDLEEVLSRAKAAGVTKVVVPGTDIESSMAALKLGRKYPGVIYPAVGIHPEECGKADVEELEKLVRKDRQEIKAIGEIGIDLYTEEGRATLPMQRELFRRQLMLALEFELPVLIHTRNSFAEAWEALSGLPKMPSGQFHCFSVDEEALTKVIGAGFYVSFCANITWSKRVARLVPHVPADRLLLETDSPFMAPGARNEPAQVAKLAEVVAGLRGESTQEVGKQTTSNAYALFNL